MRGTPGIRSCTICGNRITDTVEAYINLQDLLDQGGYIGIAKAGAFCQVVCSAIIKHPTQLARSPIIVASSEAELE